MAALLFSALSSPLASARTLLLVASASLALAIFVPGGAMAATTHVVGGDSGWTIPSDPGFYATWAAKQTYAVGDSLVFNFTSAQHNVVRVTSASCTSKPLGTAISTSPATIKLTEPGTHYFICGFPAHCDAGQILTVKVSGKATASPAPSSLSAPAPAPGAGSASSPAGPSGSPTPAGPKPDSPSADDSSSPGGSSGSSMPAAPKSGSPRTRGSLALNGLAASFVVACAMVLV